MSDFNEDKHLSTKDDTSLQWWYCGCHHTVIKLFVGHFYCVLHCSCLILYSLNNSAMAKLIMG